MINTCNTFQQNSVQENDTRIDILQQIIDSGIMDWNPQESWTAKATAYNGMPQIVNRVEEESTVMKGSKADDQEGYNRRNKPPRPRGRPVKKVITRRQYLLTVISST